jgi:photosystem II stability/assembly factor-like uncharacterized protein
MKSILRVCLLFCGLLFACSQPEIAEVPLDNSLMSLADKFYDVEALSAEKAVVIGYGGRILVTTDKGKTWKVKPSGTELALYDVEFTDDKNGWICGQSGIILHTSDGGETWKPQQSGTELSIFALSFLDANNGWGVARDAMYLRTTNGGESWQIGRVEASLEGVSEDATMALVDPTLYDVDFIDAKTGWMVGEFGKIYHTADGGVTWKEQQNSLLGQAGFDDALYLPVFFGVHFFNASEGLAVGIEGKIVQTTDGGKKWTFVGEDLSRFDGTALYMPLLRASGDGWIVGASGRVLRLQDGEWKVAALGTRVISWLRAIDFFDDNHGWMVGGYGTILHTEDGGKTWRQRFG